ncbi:DinB family protein [Aeromicrobium sp. CF3.5]|uniref:DinB family protein n=1 Tax=Aeromicrobium sp. CF3.5 TaxID=3373078 RepID=UPI003EE7A908
MADPVLRGELAVLTDYLQHFHETFEQLCSDLDAEQLARRAVPPSTLSLLGLLRHLAFAEEHWWRRVMDRQVDLPKLWGKDERRDADFDDAVADDRMVAEAWGTWRSQVAFGRSWVESAPSLDVTGQVHGQDIELREVLVHLIDEYARHCGHADLLRECIDGRTGH